MWRKRRKTKKPGVNSGFDDKAIGIAEKVRFWEEQDRINKILIPRVIRQEKLLTKHIAEHENLPQLFNNALVDSTDELLRKVDPELAAAIATARRASIIAVAVAVGAALVAILTVVLTLS